MIISGENKIKITATSEQVADWGLFFDKLTDQIPCSKPIMPISEHAEVYDALLAAGAPEEKARQAAQAINEKNSGYIDLFHQNELDHGRMKSDLNLLKWMISFNLAFSLAILIKLLI